MDNYLSGGIRKWSFVLVLICLDNMWLSSCNVVLHLDYFRAIKFVQIKKIYLYESLNDCFFFSCKLILYIHSYIHTKAHDNFSNKFSTFFFPFLFYLFIYFSLGIHVLQFWKRASENWGLRNLAKMMFKKCNGRCWRQRLEIGFISCVLL